MTLQLPRRCTSGARLKGQERMLLAPAIVAIFVLVQLTPAYCIDCFKCVTRNGSNRDCEDPFNNSSTVPENQVIPDEYLHDKVYLQTPCQTFIQKRKKVYPALVCAKMIGTLAIERKICGNFTFKDEELDGCVYLCSTDACNSANSRINMLPISSMSSIGRTLATAMVLVTMTLHARR